MKQFPSLPEGVSLGEKLTKATPEVEAAAQKNADLIEGSLTYSKVSTKSELEEALSQSENAIEGAKFFGLTPPGGFEKLLVRIEGLECDLKARAAVDDAFRAIDATEKAGGSSCGQWCDVFVQARDAVQMGINAGIFREESEMSSLRDRQREVDDNIRGKTRARACNT